MRCSASSRCFFLDDIGRPHSDLGPTTQPLEIRIYQTIARKPSSKTLLGTVSIPLGTARRSETIEEWFPVVARDPKRYEVDHVGDLNLSLRYDEVSVLPAEQYEPLRKVRWLPRVCSVKLTLRA